jgi:cobyrinic acid a,c-diamide synthase
MADIIPGYSRMGTRLTRFGYCEAQAQQQTVRRVPIRL